MKYLILIKLSITLSYLLSSTVIAGNGVERGRILFSGHHSIKAEIRDYISKKLSNCLQDMNTEYLAVSDMKVIEDEIDQGITDLYYTIDLLQHNSSGEILNEISIEVEDADYSNWRKYEERLSIKYLRDTHKLCH